MQEEPATALDAELMGPLAAIGIVKGKPFAPDARMKKILTDGARGRERHVAQPLHELRAIQSWFYYPNSSWFNFLFVSGYQFETPIPMITPQGAKPFPPTGYRHDGRAHGVLLRRHRHHARRWRCACPGSARSISSRR